MQKIYHWQRLFVAGSLLFAWVSAAQAATYTVTSWEDAGAGTLREAIASANASIGVPDTISFAISNSITVFSTLSVSDPVILEGGGTTLGALNQNITILYLTSQSGGSLVRDLVVVSGGIGLRVDSGGNTIMACRFGTDWADAANRGNTTGARVNGSLNIIGGSAAVQGNVFSGNHWNGMEITGQYNWIAGNLVGLNAAGDAALPNGSYGLVINGGYNVLGGLAPGERNFLSGNGNQGLTLNGGSCRVLGNYFSFNRAGNAVILNGNNTDVLAYGPDCWYEGNYFAIRLFLLNTGANANTVVANTVGLFPDGSGICGTAAGGVTLYGGPSHNSIGLPGGNGNLFAGSSDMGVYLYGAATVSNAVRGNTIVVTGGLPIGIINGAQNGQLPPAITLAAPGGPIAGTADPGENIELFLAEGGGVNDGTVQYLGAATADGSGNWQITSVPAATLGQYLCATATDSQNNTSELSSKVLVQPATPTPTASLTPTITPTRTITITATISPTHTITPTATPTPTSALAGLDLAGKAALAYPNPGKNQITFAVQLTQAAVVRIKLFNLSGERVGQISASLESGTQTLVWDCRDAAPGIYLARISLDGQEKATLKVAVVK